MLTEEQIFDAIAPFYAEHHVARASAEMCMDEYRAIEAAATAPLLERIAELEKQLAYAEDAAKKGDDARAAAGGMEMRIAELEAVRSALGYIAAYDLEELDAMPKDRLLQRTRAIINVARNTLAAAPAPAAPAAPEQQEPKCLTCNGHGMIGGPSFYAPDEGGVPCPDCNQPQPVQAPNAQQAEAPPPVTPDQIMHYHYAVMAGDMTHDEMHQRLVELLPQVTGWVPPRFLQQD